MSGLDYTAISGEESLLQRPLRTLRTPLRLLTGSVGLLLGCMRWLRPSESAVLSTSSSSSSFSSSSSASSSEPSAPSRSSFFPQAGVESVLTRIEPNGVGGLQVLPPPHADTNQVSCVFLASVTWSELAQASNPDSPQDSTFVFKSLCRPALLYGVVSVNGKLHPTGRAGDTVHGVLSCWPNNNFAARLEECDKFHGFRDNTHQPNAPIQRVLVAPVKRDGSTVRAVCYLHTRPPDRTQHSVTKAARYEEMTAAQILHQVSGSPPDLVGLIEAWFWLGSYVNDRSAREVDAVRLDDRTVVIMKALLPLVPSLNSTQLAKVWAGASYLQMEGQEPLLNALAEACLRKLDSFSGDDLSLVLKSLAKFRSLKCDSSAFAKILCEELQKKAAQTSVKGLVMALNALSKMSCYTPSPDEVEVIVTEVLANENDLSQKNLTITMNAMGKLGCLPDDEGLERLYSAVESRVSNFNSIDIALALNFFSKLDSDRAMPRESTLRNLALAAADKIHDFNSQDVSITLNAFANLDYNPGPELLTKLGLEAVNKAASLNAQGISMCLNAFARLDFNPGPIVMKVLGEKILELGSSGQGIAMVLNSYAKLDHHPGAEVLNGLTLSVLRIMDTLKTQEIAMTLNAIAKLDYTPDNSVVVGLCEQVLKRADTLHMREIAVALNAFAKIDFNPGNKMMAALSRQITQKLPDVDAQRIAMILNAYAKLGYHPGKQVLELLIDKALEHADAKPISERSVAMVIHSLCVLDYVAQVKTALEKLISLTPKPYNALETATLMQLYVVDLSLRWLHPETALSLPPALRLACATEAAKLNRLTTSSAFHMEVSEVLQNDLRLEHLNEDSQTGLSVDISLPSQRLIIEVDGPFHYSKSPDPEIGLQKLGTTIHKHRLLKAMGWYVVSLPFYEWEVLQPQERASYLRDKLNAAFAIKAAEEVAAKDQTSQTKGGRRTFKKTRTNPKR